MKFNLMKEEITAMLTSLTEQFATMDDHQGRIPHIEMDIFMRNIQKLYEDTGYLKKLNENSEVSITIKKDNAVEQTEFPKAESSMEKEVEIVAKPQIEESIEEDLSVIDEVENLSEEKEEIYVVQEEQVVQVAPIEEQVEITAEKEIVLDEIVEQPNVESDLFSQVKASPEISDLNKKLADARNTHSIVEKLQNNRIENLKSVIGINDKFYFINELFGGNTQKYEDIIYTLNNFKKLDDAMQYFSTLKYRFNWDEESEPFAKLVNMLERKFNLVDA